MNWIHMLLERVTGVPTEPSSQLALEEARGHTHRTIVRTLSFALEAREAQLEIIEHSAVVSMICQALGRLSGLSDSDAYILQTAAELHEVGMFTIAPDLLMQPAPLTADELARVRGQARLSAQLAGLMHHPRIARLIERQYDDFEAHAGDSDPDLFLAGILRVADVIAAVTRPRPYQRPLTVDERAQLLESGAGKRFHPVAVQCALALASGIDDVLMPMA